MKKALIMNDFISYLKITTPLSSLKKSQKVTNDEMIIPTIKTYNILFENNYNVQQLKIIARYYDLKHSGNKNELTIRIYAYLKLSTDAIKIQKMTRGKMVRKYVGLHGPSKINRSLCTNDSDFLSGDLLTDIPFSQFFSFSDEDGFIYGFDIISLYNLIVKTDKNKGVKNPYNRNIISERVIHQLKVLIRLSKLIGIPIDIDIKEVLVSNEKSLDLRILDLFQYINTLGNYSEPIWFSSLNRQCLIKFLRELMDIWNYRAQLSNETKRAICPPNGEPFYNFNFYYLNNEQDLNKMKKYILVILEKLVNSGIDADSKSLGAYYVLAALTLVNVNAASTLPWLYQSVAHTNFYDGIQS
jgi:hypothetical protein